MKTHDIAERIARQSGVSPAEAADRLDDVVNRILTDLRRGRETLLPGLGTFTQDRAGRAMFKREGGRRVASQD